MSKKLVWSLILVATCVLIFIFNASETTHVTLLPVLRLGVKATKAVIFLAFTAIGVVIGLLMK